MQILKKNQDRYNRGELKMLGKEYRNKGELQRYEISWWLTALSKYALFVSEYDPK